MFDEDGKSDEERLDEIREASEGRLRRVADRAMCHDTRQRIVAMLCEDGGKAELSEAAIGGRLPGKRRGNVLHARHHLRVLHRLGLVGHDGGDPRLHRLI